jgi:Arc/MetJ family transcription regulator
MSRTNIDIDDELITRVMRQYGLRSKRSAVDFALRRLDVEPMTKEEALAMGGTGFEMTNDEIEALSAPRYVDE